MLATVRNQPGVRALDRHYSTWSRIWRIRHGGKGGADPGGAHFAVCRAGEGSCNGGGKARQHGEPYHLLHAAGGGHDRRQRCPRVVPYPTVPRPARRIPCILLFAPFGVLHTRHQDSGKSPSRFCSFPQSLRGSVAR